MADDIEYTTTGKPHPYHIVRPSIWPLASSIAAGLFVMGLVLFMHDVEWGQFKIGIKGTVIGLVAVLLCMFFWWKDIIFESVTEKAHNKVTEIGMRYGMSMFIASEGMFFVAFFWAFFHFALFPSFALDFVWPPADIHVLPAFELPFLMTMILLLSGCSATWAHHAIMEENQDDFIKALGLTVLLGVIFLGFQVYEYGHVDYKFSDGPYAAAFFMATGFHGFHVLVGTIFLFVCWRRAKLGHFTKDKHFGFEAAAWYWHFVDVVWLFLFVAIYWWGNMIGIDLTESEYATRLIELWGPAEE